MVEAPISANGMNGTGTNAGGRKLTKNEKRRLRKRAQKKEAEAEAEALSKGKAEGDSEIKVNVEVEVDYVSASVLEDSKLDTGLVEEFKKVFEKFGTAEELTNEAVDVKEEDAKEAEVAKEKADQDTQPQHKSGLSKRARKLKSRLSVAELKQLVKRPDVVEAHDVTAADPKLLVGLKAARNTVGVPRHWCHKRKYLQGKRGIEKKPFELPEFIAMTGIGKLRAALEEAEAGKSAKQSMRAKVAPKMGKIDIDYQVLHDAFFKWQTKPPLTHQGDLYYEGKEFEINMNEKKPGFLSEKLKAALGMPENAPPPWLINMQRYGPPISYPSLRIPGLNAPIPAGASFGYQPGGWGKPPVDEGGNPIYGDVFGSSVDTTEQQEVDKSHWGEAEESESEEEEDEEGDEEMGEGEVDKAGAETPMGGAVSVATTAGLDTPVTPSAMLDLRKRGGLETPETPAVLPPRELYQVIEQQDTSVGSGLFGADKTYKVPGEGKGGGDGDVAVALNPDELEDQLEDAEGLKERYDAGVAAQQPEKEDVSDIMIAEGRKRKRKLEKESKKKKKGDSFKF
ncbi:unnamed protein product [Chrysoparadoxa australica]